MKDIMFKRDTTFLGRNGTFKMAGVAVQPCFRKFVDKLTRTIAAKSIILAPITSRGTVGSAHLEIPAEEIPRFIRALRSEADGALHQQRDAK